MGTTSRRERWASISWASSGQRSGSGHCWRGGEGGVHPRIGRDGAGKTTVFNVVSGMLRPTGGHVLFQGRDYTGSRPDLVSAMGIARNFQQVRLFPGLSVIENIAIGCHAPSGGN